MFELCEAYRRDPDVITRASEYREGCAELRERIEREFQEWRPDPCMRNTRNDAYRKQYAMNPGRSKKIKFRRDDRTASTINKPHTWSRR